MHNTQGLRRRTGPAAMIFVALLVALLVGDIPTVDEIGEIDPSKWPVLATAGDLFMTSISIEISTNQHVDIFQQRVDRIALRRSNT